MRFFILFLSLFIALSIHAEKSKKMTITLNEDCLDVPVFIPLQQLGLEILPDSIAIFELINNTEKIVLSQIESGYTPKIWFILGGKMKKGDQRTFIIKEKTAIKRDDLETNLTLTKEKDNLVIRYKEETVLKYRYTPMSPPDGIDPLYTRSGFIHPLNSPGGATLTRIQAPDHYHHYGIWGPWTLTHIGDREVDFWNLARGLGSVKFESFLSEISGQVFTGFQVLQQHLDYGAKGEDQIAINEILDVKVWNINEKVSVIDYTTIINSPLPDGILLDAYRYGGGIGFRATEKWTKDNSTVLTSEGKTRENADGSNARWCIVEGESDVIEGRSGILFLSHPLNRSHPEPMRVWPKDANGGRGDLFFEFTPIRHQAWKINNGKSYSLTYRMIVFDGKIDQKTAELYWNSYSFMPEIDIE